MGTQEGVSSLAVETSSSCSAQFLMGGADLAEWDQFVTLSPQGTVFCRSWWLNAVEPGRYAVLVLRKGGRIVAGMPLTWTGPKPFESIHMPLLTQTLGVLLEPPRRSNYARNLTDETEMTERLIEALPPFRQLIMHCNYHFTNWLPFYWAGYSQTTRYTYVLEDLTDLDKVFANFARGKKRSIKKAEETLTVHEDLEPARMYEHHATTLRKQGGSLLYDCGLFRRICEAGYANNGAKTWYAVDREGHIHATLIIIYDGKAAYALINSIDPDFRDSGASPLLHKASIIFASTVTKQMDFMGSMSRGGEKSCRMYNMVQKPYFRIWRDNRPPWARGWDCLRSRSRKIFGKLEGLVLQR